jgi:hypothetical protein
MNDAMGKRIQYINITPLPSNIPRQLALDMLKSHGEVISLNPLVTGHKAIPAPREAAADEFFAQWYEITEIITWGFGLKKKISFRGVFYDLPNGLQTHTYAPMGVDLRNKWTVRGNQPGEPREPRELGVETPLEGLYLREDVEIVCNIALAGFVKKEMKAAAGIMVDRMTRKAELLDEGVLHAMFEDGKLKTSNPNVQGQNVNHDKHHDKHYDSYLDTGSKSPVVSSPGHSAKDAYIDSSEHKYTTYRDLVQRRESHRQSHYLPAYQQEGYQGPEDHTNQGSQSYGGAEKSRYIPQQQPTAAPGPVEVEGSFYHPQQSPNQFTSPKSNIPTFTAELADTSVAANEMEAKPAPLRPHRNSTQQQIPSPQPSPALPPRPSSQQATAPSQPIANPPYPTSPPIPQQQPTTSTSPQPSTNPPYPTSPTGSTRPHPNRSSTGGYTRNELPSQAAKRESVGSSNYSITNPDEGFYSRNPSQRSAHTSVDQGLANRVQGLGIDERQDAQAQVDPARFGKGAMSKCPVCGNFEGDEDAVRHHVENHFG